LAAIFGGIGVSAAADEDQLRSILPSPSSEPTPRRIGTSEVNAIRAATTGYRSSHFQYGGGLMRAAAVAQLDYVLKLRGAQCSDSVRRDLAFATAELSNTAAWMSFTAGRHEDARRLWAISLNGARESGHPQSADLMVETLMNASVQAFHLGSPHEVVSLAKYASSLIATPGAIPVSAPTRHYTMLTWRTLMRRWATSNRAMLHWVKRARCSIRRTRNLCRPGPRMFQKVRDCC
jgi:hypothetical protein